MYIQGGEPQPFARAAGWLGYKLRTAEQKNSLFWPLWLTLLLCTTAATAAAESHFAASLDMVALVSYNGYSGPLPFLAFFCSTAIKAADDIQPIKASSFLCYSTTRGGPPKQGSMARRHREVSYSQRRRKKPFRRVSPGDGGVTHPLLYSHTCFLFFFFTPSFALYPRCFVELC